MLNANKQPYLLTICSGKGGVGKSFIASNIAFQLAAKYEKVLIIDADIMFPNQHLMFGIEPHFRLDDWFFNRENSLNQENINNNVNIKSENIQKVISQISKNLFIIAGSIENNLELQNNFSFVDLYHSILLETDFDFIIIDTNAGITNSLIEIASLSDKIGTVVTDEPTSIIDAYGIVKILKEYTDSRKINLILNNFIDDEDANEIIQKFNKMTKHFLGISVDILGIIPYSKEIRKSIIEQNLISVTEPNSTVVNRIEQLAKQIIEINKFI